MSDNPQIPVTPEMVVGVWAYLSELHNTSILPKSSSKEMHLIGEALEGLGLLSKSDFLTKFTTTIGHQIYVPYALGDPTAASLIDQLITGVHEHQHVIQGGTGLNFAFATQYLTDSTHRVIYEAEAIRAGITVRMFLGQKIDNDTLDHYAQKMTLYATTEQDRAFLKHYLKLSLPTLRKGAVPDQAALEALAWLRARGT